MANLTNFIQASVSQQLIRFKPGNPAQFEVEVINESDRFASFQLDLKAEGADPNLAFQWYHLSPEVCAKKPPGDRTRFQVDIIDTPVPGFVGTINLVVQIFSLELAQTERQLVRLVVEAGESATPVQVSLPQPQIQVMPEQAVTIPVWVRNPDRRVNAVSLELTGLDPSWIVDQPVHRLQLQPGSETEIDFQCQLPAAIHLPQAIYPFQVTVIQTQGTTIGAIGELEVLPKGEVAIAATPLRHQIPSPQNPDNPAWKANAVTYEVQVHNCSNVRQQVKLAIAGSALAHCQIQVIPESIDLKPGEQAPMLLVVTARRSLLGLTRARQLQVTAQLSDPRIAGPDPELQLELELELDIAPIVPPWLQLSSGLLLGLLLTLLWLLRPITHQDPVNTVRLSGDADRVLSGSNDQTIRRWSVQGDRLQANQVVASTRKAVRVLQYRPVDNNQVAAGLENGEVQLWKVASQDRNQDPDQAITLSYGKANRVFSLAFTQDARSLFSAHGNGLVLQWDVSSRGLLDPQNRQQPLRQKQFNFAVNDLALLGTAGETLAVAGRYNRLMLWNWTKGKSGSPAYAVASYPQGDQNDYILSLATAESKPDLLATADSRGTISLWDMSQCLATQAKSGCEVQLDQWSDGHRGKAVRSIALSANGCYLASAGDDGRAMLWPLDAQGRRNTQSSFFKGQELTRVSTKLNAIDVDGTSGNLRVVSGGDDHQVRFFHPSTRNPECESVAGL